MQAHQSAHDIKKTSERAALLEQKRSELRANYRELDDMLSRALNNATDKQNRKHLELSRMHNSALLNYKMSLLTACWHLNIDIDLIKIDYDFSTQLFNVKFPPDPAIGSMIAIALNNRQAPQLANSTKAYVEITKAIECFDSDKQRASKTKTTARPKSIQRTSNVA